jgi:hypothetical protein
MLLNRAFCSSPSDAVSRPERYASDSTAFPTLRDTGLKAFHGFLKRIDGMLAEREWFSHR